MLTQSPSTALFEFIKKVLDDPQRMYMFEEGDAYFHNGFLFWPIDTEDENIIYYAVNPNSQEVYELDFPEQDPASAIPIHSEEDLIWLLEDLLDFQDFRNREMALNCLPLPPQARYTDGCTEGFIHSHS